MSIPSDHRSRLDRTEQEAAVWVLRADRGLTPAEQDECSEWLAANPSHREQFARHRRHWDRLDLLVQWRPEHAATPNPDLLAPPRRKGRWHRFVVPMALAAAAGVALAVFLSRPGEPHDAPSSVARSVSPPPTPPALGPQVLEDGTRVELNRGAGVTAAFTATERRVRLDRGEAHFEVTKDPSRPFIVHAGGVDVRAVGTAFNVRVDDNAVEVLVTEGRVQLAAAPATQAGGPPAASWGIPVLEARQRAVVPLHAPQAEPQIATLTPGEIERVLSWQHRLLDFTAAPLNEIVAEFNRRNVVQLVVIDPELAAIKVSASLRSDNVDGFVRLLEAGFGARAERRGDAEILLRHAPVEPGAELPSKRRD